MYLLFMIVVMCGMAYCVSLVLIGFPVSIWEWITKRKADKEKEERAIKWVAIILAIFFVVHLL